MSTVAERLTGIRQQISAAAVAAGRDPGGVQLCAVSKTFPAEAVTGCAAAMPAAPLIWQKPEGLAASDEN